MRLEATIKRYIGDSSERPPMPGDLLDDGTAITPGDLPAGSSFFLEDTGLIRRWTGQVWTEGFPEPRNEELQVQLAILAELRAVREEARTGLPVLINELG